MLKGRVPTEKMAARIKYREQYFVVGMSLPNFGLQWKLVRFELGTVMTDSMKK